MLSALISYIVPAALGWIAKSIHVWIQDYVAKQKLIADSNAKAQAAVDAANKSDDTTGLFGGKP